MNPTLHVQGEDSPQDRDGRFLEGERRLAHAVYSRALCDLRSALRRVYGNRSYGYRSLDEVQEWFFGTGPARVEYPFELCCDVMDWRIDEARARVKDIMERIIKLAPTGARAMRRLGWADVYRIRAALGAGDSARLIAARFNIDTSMVRRIRTRKRWQMTPIFSNIPDALAVADDHFDRETRLTVVGEKPARDPDNARWRRRPIPDHTYKAFREMKTYFRSGSREALENAYHALGKAMQLKCEADRADEQKPQSEEKAA